VHPNKRDWELVVCSELIAFLAGKIYTVSDDRSARSASWVTQSPEKLYVGIVCAFHHYVTELPKKGVLEK
jgi:hypothetical protein